MPLSKVSKRVHFVRTTRREGDTSPKRSAEVSGERTPEAHKKRIKIAQNKQRRIRNKKKERREMLANESLVKQMASFRRIEDSGSSDNVLGEKERAVQTVAPLPPVKNKKGFPSSHHVGKTKKVVRAHNHPQGVLEGKRARAYLRAIKREINKVLKYAFRKARVYGYAFYALILSFLCMELQRYVARRIVGVSSTSE